MKKLASSAIILFYVFFFRRDFVDTEMRNLLDKETSSGSPATFIVYALPETNTAEAIPLQRATKYCPDRPILVVCRNTNDGSIRARCTVPRQQVSNRFGAASWLAVLAQVFEAQLADPQKGQRPEEVAVMKSRTMSAENYAALLSKATLRAEVFATENMNVGTI